MNLRQAACFQTILLLLCIFTPFVCTKRGPVFIHEPPSKVHFSNSTGVVLPCSAHGKPPPSITWLTEDGSKVNEIAGVRKLHANGSLHLLPFPPAAYTASVYAQIYVCKAESPQGIILSRPVRVRAVVRQFYEVQVYDEFVISGNTAVMKCHVPSFVADYVIVTSWVRGNGDKIVSDVIQGGRYSVFPTGELHIRHVTKMDEFQSYQCSTQHILSKQISVSSVAGRLMVNDPRSSVPPRITDSRALIRVSVGDMVEVPCAAQGYPIPQYKWFKLNEDVKESENDVVEMTPDGRIKLVEGSLLFKNIVRQDAGKYFCVVSSSVGEEQAHTTLDVRASLSAHITPQIQTVDAGATAYLNCTPEGFPILNITWLKDGKALKPSKRLKFISEKRVSIHNVNRTDRGMYQCVIYNNEDSAQGSAQIRLGDASPEWLNSSGSQVASPGTSLTLECSVRGSPSPKLFWVMRGEVVTNNQNYIVKNRIVADKVFGQLHISSIKMEDSGIWGCTAYNRAGTINHKEKLSVRGPPSIRQMEHQRIVSGEDASFDCIVMGYPIDIIFWEKDGVVLPVNQRQKLHENGTLTIKEINKESDSGAYMCIATAGQISVRAQMNISVLVPPEIDHHLFTWGSGYPIGAPARIMCVVANGDFPLKFSWYKENHKLKDSQEITIRYLDDRTSVLLFHDLREKNAGNYSCTVFNKVANDTVFSHLLVKVPPSWREAPKDISVIVGTTVRLPCSARGSPTPTIQWRKAEGRLPRQYVEIDSYGDNVRVAENNTLIINSIRREQGGELLCTARNKVGSDLTKAVKVFVKVPPKFSRKTDNVTVTSGKIAIIECEAIGNLPISIDWSVTTVGNKIAESDLVEKYSIATEVINGTQNFRTFSQVSPQNSAENGIGVVSTIRVPTQRKEDSKAFYCVAINIYGNDTKTIHLIVQETPLAVQTPKVLNSGSRSVRLEWGAPLHDGNSPIIFYRLLLINETDNWANVEKIRRLETPVSTITVTELQPATAYFVRILAVNSVGASPASSALRIVTTHEPPSDIPTNVRATAISSTSIQVTWKMPNVAVSDLETYGYYVTYKPSNKSGPIKYVSKKNPKFNIRQLEVTLQGLGKFVSYTITVQAFNQAGVGPKSSPVVVSTKEDVPSRSPSDIFCSSLSPTSLLIKWKPPSIPHANGIIKAYNIYNYVNPESVERKSVSSKSAKLTNLKPYTNYSISVSAETRVGNGVKSEPIHCLTDEDSPGPITKIKALSVSRNSILISWEPPEIPNGVILKYALTMRKHQPFSSFSNMDYPVWPRTFPSSHSVVDPKYFDYGHGSQHLAEMHSKLDTPLRWQVQASGSQRSWVIPGTENEYLVEGLNDRTSYSFSVRAATVIGEGPQGTSVIQKPSGEAPAAIASFSKELLVPWSTDVMLPCKIVGKNPIKRQWSYNGKVLRSKSGYNQGGVKLLSNGSLRISSLKHSNEGNYTCEAINQHGSDTIIYRVLVKAPPMSPSLQISGVTYDTISIEWDNLVMESEMLLGYKLYIKGEYGAWTKIEISGTKTEYEIKDLECGVRYQLYMVAFNHVGLSEKSQLVATRTLGREPVVPLRSSFLMENTTSLGLLFASWDSGGCPITSFVIEYQRRGSSAWRSVSNVVKWSEAPYVIKNLSKSTAFILRVTAHNTAGSTVATYSFSTFPKGGPYYTKGPSSHGSWIQHTSGIIAITSASILVLVAITLAVIFSKRKTDFFRRNVEKDKSTGAETSVMSTLNGSTRFIRRSSVDTLQQHEAQNNSPQLDRELHLQEPHYSFEINDSRPVSMLEEDSESTNEHYEQKNFYQSRGILHPDMCNRNSSFFAQSRC